MVHNIAYNELTKKEHEGAEMRYIMSERIENAIVAAVGACFIFFSGWGFLAIADAIYKVIN